MPPSPPRPDPCGRRTLTAIGLACLLTAAAAGQERPSIRTEADFLRAMEELSNRGRWGGDDELGAHPGSTGLGG